MGFSCRHLNKFFQLDLESHTSFFLQDEVLSALIESECADALLIDLKARLGETAILCHPKIRRIARFWEQFLGRQESVIRKALCDIGLSDPPDDLVSFITGCLGSYRARKGFRDKISWDVERSVFEEFAKRRESTELRCEMCGYHFREGDLNSRRAALASEFALDLANSVDPRREGDLFKPVSLDGKDKYFTKLELDHIIPIAALGWSDADNIQILCRFCNSGKLHFLYPFESISPLIASSLGVAYETIVNPNRLSYGVVSTLWSSGRVCSVSGKSSGESELTVCFREREGRVENEWFVPWNLEVRSYDYIDHGS